MTVSRHSEEEIRTGGQFFAEKASVDLVRNDRGNFELVVWDGSTASVMPQFHWNGKTFLAPLADKQIAKLVPFPDRVNSCGSTSDLFGSLLRFFAQHPGLPASSVEALSYLALASWFPEYAAIRPLVSIVTSDGVALTSLLGLMRCAFRRCVHLAEVTRRGLLSLPSWLQPTLLIDQPVPSRELQRMLHMIVRPGALILDKGCLYEISCCATICSAEPLTDQRLLQSAVHIAVVPTSQRLPALDPEFLANATQDLQGKLLAYRFQNFAKVRASTFDAPGLNSPTREIARVLGRCVADAPELQSRVITLLEGQDEENKAGRAVSPQAVVAEAALFLSHEESRRSAYVGDIGTISNGILKGRGETLELESRAVGHILRTLGLPTKRLGEAGRGISFLTETRREIHALAWGYGVRSIQNGGIRGCPFCAEAQEIYVGGK